MTKKELELVSNPLINYYYCVYKINPMIIFETLKNFGDTKKSHRFCEFINNVKENSNMNYDYSKSFDDIFRDYNISQAA